MTDRVREFMHNLAVRAQRAEIAQIRSDPEAHRTTRIMADGKPATYRFWPDARRKGVRWCVSCHRNAAGFFLSWRETVTREETRRDRWGAWKTKTSARAVARRNAGGAL